MKLFDIFHHPEDGYEAVKHGFSWPALFFGWIWAVVKDLGYLAVFGLLSAIAALIFVAYQFQQSGNSTGQLLANLAQLAFFIWMGFNGNKWRHASLLRRGFAFLGTIAATSGEQAIIDFTSAGATVDA